MNAIDGGTIAISFIDSLTCNDLLALRGFGSVRARKALNALRDSAGLPRSQNDEDITSVVSAGVANASTLTPSIAAALGDIAFPRAAFDPACRRLIDLLDIGDSAENVRITAMISLDASALRDTGKISESEAADWIATIQDVFMVQALRDYREAKDPPARDVCIAIAMIYTAITNTWGFNEWDRFAGIAADALLQVIDIADPHLPPAVASRLAVYRIDLTVAQRVLQGETLAQVGISLGVTRERIRQRLKRVGVERHKIQQIEAAQRTERKRLASESRRIQKPLVEEFVRGHPGCFEHEISSHFGIPITDIHHLVTDVSWLVLNARDLDDRSTRKLPLFLEARRKSVAALKLAATLCFPVTGNEYDSLLRQGLVKGPSRMRVIQVFGSWKVACNEAGVECGVGILEIGQTANWTTSELIESVCAFLIAKEFRGASYQYDEWREKHNVNNDIPSFGTVRKRLGPSWRDVRRQALLGLRQRWETDEQNQ